MKTSIARFTQLNYTKYVCYMRYHNLNIDENTLQKASHAAKISL